jgi:O-antigen/teichoic acid export membrane protein/predicted O-methyltransferase YrrM
VKRDYLTTFATEVIVILSYLLAFRVVATHLGANGFAEYALSRRTLSFISPLAIIGLDVAVARFVAYARSNGSDDEQTYAGAALAMLAASVGTLSIVLLLFQGFFANLFFGSTAYVHLITPLPLLLLGSGLHVVTYGYLRGRSQIQRANVLMGLNMAVVPLAAAVLFGSSIPRILFTMGAGWTVVSAIFLALTPFSLGAVRSRAVDLAGFGLPRVPGDVLQLALFTLPGILIAHLVDVRTAGIVAFGIAALGMVGTVLTPISFVLLPAAAGFFARGWLDEVRREVLGVMRVALPALLGVILLLEIFARPIVTGYLGVAFAPSADVLRLVIVGALPWGIYVMVRSVIDARHTFPVNARNMVFAFATFLSVIGITSLAGSRLAAGGVVFAFVASLYVLGGLTAFEVYRTLSGKEMEPAIPPLAAGAGSELDGGSRYLKVRRYARDLEMYVKDSGGLLIALLSLILLGALLVAWSFFGRTALLVGLGGLVCGVSIVTAVQLEVYRRSQARNYRQIESLFSLFSLLKISHPLPPMRGWAISPDFAAIAMSLIYEVRPRCIVEAGSGVSTIITGYCLKELGAGHVIALEQDEAFAAITQENIRRHGLESYASVRYAPLKKILLDGKEWLWYDTEQLADVTSVDMAVIDGPPGNIQKWARYPALPVLVDRLSKHAVIVMDDCFRHDEKETVRAWQKNFDGFVAQQLSTEKVTIVLRRAGFVTPAAAAPMRSRLFDLAAFRIPD